MNILNEYTLPIGEADQQKEYLISQDINHVVYANAVNNRAGGLSANPINLGVLTDISTEEGRRQVMDKLSRHIALITATSQ